MKRLLVLIIGLVTILSVGTAISSMASAEVNTISWTRSKPTLGSSQSTSMNDVYRSMYCPVDYSDINISGLSYTVNACMIHGENMSFATYSRYGVAVSFRNDKLMYPLSINCDSSTCTYLPQTDTLVMLQHKVNGIVFGLVVYKNFSSRLERHVNPSNLSVSYSFNYANPSYELKDTNGYYWPVVSFAGSDNGRYLAVELRERGVGLLDIDTLSMKYITGNTYLYWHGFDPMIEFAVSNDGKFVAEMGRNVRLTVYEVNDECGELLTPQRMDQAMKPLSNPCPTSPIDFGFIDNFHEAYNPVFSPSGDSLSFFATSWEVGPRKIELRASGYGGLTLDYLALGDSFSSGEGAELDSEYLPNTNKGFDKCHISNNSYPFILARMQKFDMNFVRSVACSGAVMDDVVGDDDIYWGQSSRINSYSPKLTVFDKYKLQQSSADLFFPGQIHQESFVSKYHPVIITLGIGGNDIDFSDKLKACLGPDTCSWAGTAMGREKTAVEIKSIYDKLVRTYRSIHNDSPDSKILVIGYPKLIYETNDCGGLTGYLLNTDERRFIDEGVHYLNQVIKSAAATAGVGYVDIENSLGSSALCGNKPSAMNAIRLGDDSALIDKLGWLKLIGNESFHPNTLGHARIASTISNFVSNLANYNYCSDNLIICPVSTLPPEPSEYWVPDVYHNYPRQISTTFVADDDADEAHKVLSLPEHTFAPDSDVVVTVASTEQTVGTYQANDDGSFNQSINLSIDLEPGFHTFNLYGTSFSNESIDLYQVFAYDMPEPETDIEPDPANNLSSNNKTTLTSSHTTAQEQDKISSDDNHTTSPTNKTEVLGDQDTIQAKSNSDKEWNIFPVILSSVLVLIGIMIILLKKRQN